VTVAELIKQLQKAKPTAEILLWNEVTEEGDLPLGSVTVTGDGVTLKPAD
jgi:hypothetical protein